MTTIMTWGNSLGGAAGQGHRQVKIRRALPKNKAAGSPPGGRIKGRIKMQIFAKREDETGSFCPACEKFVDIKNTRLIIVDGFKAFKGECPECHGQVLDYMLPLRIGRLKKSPGFLDRLIPFGTLERYSARDIRDLERLREAQVDTAEE